MLIHFGRHKCAAKIIDLQRGKIAVAKTRW